MLKNESVCGGTRGERGRVKGEGQRVKGDGTKVGRSKRWCLKRKCIPGFPQSTQVGQVSKSLLMVLEGSLRRKPLSPDFSPEARALPTEVVKRATAQDPFTNTAVRARASLHPPSLFHHQC